MRASKTLLFEGNTSRKANIFQRSLAATFPVRKPNLKLFTLDSPYFVNGWWFSCYVLLGCI